MLKLIYRLFFICVALTVLVVGIAFIYNNQQSISLDLLIWQTPELAFGLIVLISLLLGFILAYIVSLGRITRLRIRNKSLSNKVKNLRQKIYRLEEVAKNPKVSEAQKPKSVTALEAIVPK